MADLIDRISGESENMDPARSKIPVHQFIGGLRLYTDGTLTAAEAKLDYDLQGAELTQANSLVTTIDSKSGTAKIAYVLRVEAVCFKIEDYDDTLYHNPDGSIDKSRVATDLEL